MASTTYTGRTMSGECVAVTVQGETIERVEPLPNDPALPYLLPVLVDLQHNGALGTPFNALEAHGIERLDAIARHLRRHGVGRALMTLTTWDFDALLRTAREVDRRLDASANLARLFFGLFSEGIFISPLDGWRGAHARPYIMPPDYDRFKRLDEAAGGRIRVVNLAPEEPGGLDFVARAARDRKIVAIGHACPSTEIISEAVARGASFVTHFANGAAPMVHRFKNPFWGFLDRPELKLGLIGDGFHLTPEIVRVAFVCKGREHCFLVSDAAGLSGCPPGRYGRGDGNDSVIEPNGHLHLADSELLAGAWFQQDRSVEWLVEKVGLPFLAAWAQCSIIPARIIGLRLPELKAGQEASFVQARWDNGLVIEQSIHLGAPSLSAPVRTTEPSPLNDVKM